MESLGKIFIGGLLAMSAVLSHALPPSMEADRKLLAAESAAKAEDWGTAVAAYEAYEGLGIAKLPEHFQYLYGHALFKAGKFDDASKRIEAYLDAPKAATAKYYKEALMDLNGIDQGRKKFIEDRAAAEVKSAADAKAERRKKAEEDKIDAAWVNNKTQRAEYPARGRNTCSEVTRVIKEMSVSAKNISCSCRVQEIDHPAYRSRQEDACTATWRANYILDGYEDRPLSPYARKDILEGDTDGWTRFSFNSHTIRVD